MMIFHFRIAYLFISVVCFCTECSYLLLTTFPAFACAPEVFNLIGTIRIGRNRWVSNCMDAWSLNHKTNIVFIEGNLTAVRYQHEVLQTVILLHVQKQKRITVAVGWRTSPHTTRVTTVFLNANNINVMDVPPKPLVNGLS